MAALVAVCFLAMTAGAQTSREDGALPEGVVWPHTVPRFPVDVFSVVTWNLGHFTDEYDDPYIDSPMENDPNRFSEERVELFSEAIRNLDADIVVLQEFESVSYLRELAAERFPERQYRYFAGSESPDWYQNVVMMSRFPLGVLRDYSNVTTKVEDPTPDPGKYPTQSFLNSRMWIAEVFVDEDYAFFLCGLHLKSGRGERNDGIRLGQIRFLRGEFEQLLSRDPEANLLIAGDLNSVPGSAEYRRLLRGGGVATFMDPLEGRDGGTIPPVDPVRRIDYLLPERNMAAELIADSMGVAYPMAGEKMVKIGDHLPVMAYFRAENLPVPPGAGVGHESSSQ